MSASDKTTAIPYDNMSTNSEPEESFMNNCCFCIPLRIGCFILGYLSLIINIYQSINLIGALVFIYTKTNGFDHLDDEIESETGIYNYKDFLDKLGVLLVVLMLANATWLLINIACLVGLHKKRPGPIKVFIGFATARLIISLIYFIYLTINTKTYYIEHFIDFGFAAYFILVYYIYAAKLDRERIQNRQERFANNIAFIYPTNMDKKTLVA